MRTPICTLIFLFSLLMMLRAADAPSPQEQQLVGLVQEIKAQQALITDNQAKIEKKLATVAESLRVARIYSARGGGK
jgi:hypothetical protein